VTCILLSYSHIYAIFLLFFPFLFLFLLFHFLFYLSNFIPLQKLLIFNRLLMLKRQPFTINSSSASIIVCQKPKYDQNTLECHFKAF
jgi:hypothetical protein